MKDWVRVRARLGLRLNAVKAVVFYVSFGVLHFIYRLLPPSFR